MDIKPGDTVFLPMVEGPVRIDVVQRVGEKFRIIYTDKSGSVGQAMISSEDASRIKPAGELLTWEGDAKKAFLSMEERRYRFAYMYDPLMAMSTSKVDPLPHQIDAVYGKILNFPRIRFLLADDPGAGKTIMAGLVIKELKMRGLANRILIVVPGHLKYQWLYELQERFGETFTIVDRKFMDSKPLENVWMLEKNIITSIDFAKQPDILKNLSHARFDLVIVDEAHKMSADEKSETARYKLGKKLSEISEHMLFLTATPHNGNDEMFRRFIALLRPDYAEDIEMLRKILNSRDNDIYLRRMKENLKDIYGRKLFKDRFVKTTTYNLSDEEMDLYDDLTRYIKDQYNKAISMAERKRRNISFAMSILQRRMASSLLALRESLKRRFEKLNKIKDAIDKKVSVKQEDQYLDPWDDYDENEQLEIEDYLLSLTASANRRELENEIFHLKRLISKTEDLMRRDVETKLEKLKEIMDELDEKSPGEKLIIFTESRDTMRYLQKRLESWGYSVVVIHGGMKMDERREAVSEFRHNARVLVATEAAGEGINLQFCHLMINYDIPWNPNRLEQRIGRIHRYGQKRDVFVINLVAGNTIEGRILERLVDKLESIRKSLGDVVFDVVSQILNEKDIRKIIEEVIREEKSAVDAAEEVELMVEEAKKYREMLDRSLARSMINYELFESLEKKAEENRMVPAYLEKFFIMVFEMAGWENRIKKIGKGTYSVKVPRELQEIGEESQFRLNYGYLMKEYPRVTFDKKIANEDDLCELVSLGHPLFEAVLEYVKRNYMSHLEKGASFLDPSGRFNGYMAIYEVSIKDKSGKVVGKRLFTVFVPDSGEPFEINPAILWDMKPDPSPRPSGPGRKDLENVSIGIAIESISKYKEELLEQRRKDKEILEKYVETSIRKRISEEERKYFDYLDRKKAGENMDIAIRQAEERIDDYRKKLENLRKRIDSMLELREEPPVFIGAIRITPLSVDEPDKERIEKAGMEFVMKYEREHGREPEDVSGNPALGFDIRSVSRDPERPETRYIEVKAKAGKGPVLMTPNEWMKASMLKENYWLYVVFNALDKPELKTIRDPANNLKAREIVDVVRYEIPVEEIEG